MSKFFSGFLFLLLVCCNSQSDNRSENPLREFEFAWSGGITENSARIGVKADSTAEIGLLLNKDPEQLTQMGPVKGIRVGQNQDHYTVFDIDGLEPGQTYYYAFLINGRLRNDGHEFRTFESGPHSFSFAFSSCAETNSSSPIFSRIREMNPSFFMHTGDMHYDDIATNCTANFRRSFRRVWNSPTQSELYKHIPLVYMWDDHDFGPNDSDRSNPCRREALAAYRRYVPHYPLAFDGPESPVSQAFTVGRVRFIVTDLRSQKEKPQYQGCTRTKIGTNFGDKQHLDWFKDELLQARNRGEFVYWVSTIPYINAPGGSGYICTEMDNWGGYPEERRKIANFIEQNNIPIAILSGDAHMVAIDDGRNSRYADGNGMGIPVFQASPLDQHGSFKGGPYSEGFQTQSGQFGWVEVIDYGGSEICFRWSAMNRFGGLVSNREGQPISYDFCREI